MTDAASSSFEQNRAFWDSRSDEYQAQHAAQLNEMECVWGMWAIPESEVNALGDVTGKDILELGCGAAQWSIFLAKRGARPVGLDNSARQLEHARELMAGHGVDFPLVHAPAESVPLPDASFDIVFCDHGGMTWGDPFKTVPEAARLVRPGGLLVFNMSSIWWEVCYNEATDDLDTQLQRAYFGWRRWDDGESVSYNLSYGDWIRLFRANGLVVEDLIELQPTENATSTYSKNLEWARRWPIENIWKARKVVPHPLAPSPTRGEGETETL